MNEAGRELWRRAGLIQIVIFHTVRIVFDNVAAAHIIRTAGSLAALPVWEPPGCGARRCCRKQQVSEKVRCVSLHHRCERREFHLSPPACLSRA